MAPPLPLINATFVRISATVASLRIGTPWLIAVGFKGRPPFPLVRVACHVAIQLFKSRIPPSAPPRRPPHE